MITKKTSNKNTAVMKNRAIKYIVVHFTAGHTSRKGIALNVANYFATSAKASADFIVDDELIVQYNPDIRNKYTYHCGGRRYNTKGGRLHGIARNSNSIGIEICSSNKKGKMTYSNDKDYYFTDKVLANTLRLIKQLMKEYNIDAEHVIRHYDVTGKLCPGIIGWNYDSKDESKWMAFRQQIRALTEEFKPYTVVVDTEVLNVRKEPKATAKKLGSINKGSNHTVTEEQGNWGKIEDGGWINLKYTMRLRRK